MAKRTFEEKQKKQRDKLMGTTSTAEGKEYTPAVDEKDKLIEKYRKKGYKIVLENNTPIILCKDRKEMMDIKERIGITNFSIGFKFSPSKYDDLLDKPLIDDRIPIKSKTNNNSRKKSSKTDEVIEKTESITTAAINISDKKDNINEEKTENIKEEIFNDNKPKRRGRPKKEVKEDIEESKPITKKRGRPKKNIEDTVAEPIIATVKKRGRPKKDVVLEKETIKVEEKPKAKRGRPRKAKY